MVDLEDISRATTCVDDEAVNKAPPRALDGTALFLSHGLHPHDGVFRNLSFGLKLRSCPEQGARSEPNLLR